jgi:hypothetical protein
MVRAIGSRVVRARALERFVAERARDHVPVGVAPATQSRVSCGA